MRSASEAKVKNVSLWFFSTVVVLNKWFMTPS